LITPVLPEGIGSFGHSGTVQPQDVMHIF
jgi:hypothetical protein